MSPVERWRALRDRLLASPRFQRWSARFPLTRPIAHRYTRALFDLCAGFVYAQVLFACVRLDVFERLAQGPLTSEQLADRAGVAPEGMQRLLDAAASLSLVERRKGGRFGLGPLGAALRGNPGIAAMVEHHHLLYDDLRDPVGLLSARSSETHLASYWRYAAVRHPSELGADAVSDYSDLMASSQAWVADQVLQAVSFRRHRVLLDIGGGDGTFARHVAARWPHLRVTVFDLPPVAERARSRAYAHGLADRVGAIGGDFFEDPLPPGADIVSLVRVVHDHDDREVVRLLRNIRAALSDDGVVLIAEPMAGTRGAEPVGHAYFGMYLWAMGHGRARTPEELGRLLADADLEPWRMPRTHTPLLTRVLLARPRRAR